MELNHLAIFVCAFLSMIIGSIWYGPLFGRKFMKAIGVSEECFDDKEKMKEQQKKMLPIYFIQLVVSIIQLYTLAYFISTNNTSINDGILYSICIWAGFIIPTIAGSVLWNNDSKENMWTKFLLQSGNQFIVMVISAYVLGIWR